MALTDKLATIANAIREKSKKTNSLTIDDMPTEILSLKHEDKLKPSEYPTYVIPEVKDLIKRIKNVRKPNSIVFIATSDTHYCSTQSTINKYSETNASCLQSSQAMKVLSYTIKPDFFAHLGDVGCGDSTTTPEMLRQQIEEYLDMFCEARSDLPMFIAIGNHDSGIHYDWQNSSSGPHTLDGNYMYNNFTKFSESDNTTFGSTANGGYCYRDFPDKKLRVFLLNTSEAYIGTRGTELTRGAQRLWLANSLIDLNSKDDASEWNFIILCHFPADYGQNMPMSELLKAYIDGSNITITDAASGGDGTNETVSFGGKNSAKMIAQFHGHIHNFKTSKLHSYATGSPVQYNAYRIAIPNGDYQRHNYYSVIDGYPGIDFSESTSYTKTTNENATTFVVNVINPSEEKIYSFCYGAGYDRIIGYDDTIYHTIKRTLSNATTNGTAIDVADGSSYSETITLDVGYIVKYMTVMMGGVDITADVISYLSWEDGDGNCFNKIKINIPNVTGNIVITAKAQLNPNFTNLVPYSINIDMSDYYGNGDGYSDGCTFSGSTGALSTLANYTTTGYIPITPSNTDRIIRIAGDGISFAVDPSSTSVGDYNCKIAFYDESFNYIQTHPGHQMGTGNYQGVVIEEDSTVLTWKISAQYLPNQCNASYIKVCAKGNGADLIVTVDEEISYGGTSGGNNHPCFITQNLTNVISSNTQAFVMSNGPFSTKLTPIAGYTIDTVVVTMGGQDITDTAYTNGVVTIDIVTGDIVITSVGQETVVTYTNLLPTAIGSDGNPYNGGQGWKANTRLGSSGAESTSEATGIEVTGFIPVKFNDVVYLGNVSLVNKGTNASKCYIFIYDSSFVPIGYHRADKDIAGDMTLDSNNNYTSFKVGAAQGFTATPTNAAYLRFSADEINASSIVTVNEPIE